MKSTLPSPFARAHGFYQYESFFNLGAQAAYPGASETTLLYFIPGLVGFILAIPFLVDIVWYGLSGEWTLNRLKYFEWLNTKFEDLSESD